jgi:hypothetical protein
MIREAILDGIYSITFRGRTDWGMGMLLIQSGIITGADSGGVLYDGKYIDNGDSVALDVKMTVPPGATLVQGTPARSTAYTIPIQENVPKSALAAGTPVLLNLPPGPVNVIFRKLRALGR